MPTCWFQSKDNYFEIGKGQKSQLVDEIDRRVGNRLWDFLYEFSVDLWVRYEPGAEASLKINFPLKEMAMGWTSSCPRIKFFQYSPISNENLAKIHYWSKE